VRIVSTLLVLFLGAAVPPKKGDDAPPLPPAQIVLRIDAPDAGGPWKMVVTNKGDVPVRFAADGRLLSFEVPKPEDPYGTKKKLKISPPLVCKLPAELRPTGVVEDRAVMLGPGARYEEVISPALYCFGDALAKALVPGATVVAKLGFAPPARPPKKDALPPPPFIAEPATPRPNVAPLKQIVSEPFVLPAAANFSTAPADAAPPSDDPNSPRIELTGPTRVDTANELTVGMTLSVKNVGGRPTAVHTRRDHLMFEIDGPGGSAHCGAPAERRNVPADAFVPLAPGAARSIDVWVGEMCADMVFDRPGLYRVRPSIAFPATAASSTIKVWSDTVTAKEPVLVRVKQGRLPFYTTPPQVFGPSP